VHIQDAREVYSMPEEDPFVLYMKLSMVINVELLVVLECGSQILKHAALILLSGKRMSVRGVSQHLVAYSILFALELKSLGREVPIITQLNHMMLIIQRSQNVKIISLQIAGIVLKQCVHHVE